MIPTTTLPCPKPNSFDVIGLMSGTSLDGLDIACCHFEKEGGSWNYQVLAAETIPYQAEWKATLSNIESGSAIEYVTADIEYGHLAGRLTREFLERTGLKADFIASHGHTIFHRPDRRITSQIGRGSAISAETGLRTVCDFRSLDVALGGQGAPLVPIGDDLLFGKYDYCLNIGGFANISFKEGNRRLAFDVGPANIVLNRLALKAGYAYDPEGSLAAAGMVNEKLLSNLNALPYFHQPPPKSLGKEWVVEHVLPLVEGTGLGVNDQLATFCEHIAMQIAAATGTNPDAKILVTGGGAFNLHLAGRIRHHAVAVPYTPDPLTVNYKEALIFAFLGVLRVRDEVNCLQSVTGAIRDSSGGAIY